MKRLTKAFRRVYRGQKGFTLIELLVVVGILALLAGVVTLSVTQFVGKGASEAMLTEQHNIQTAVAAYAADNDGAIPATIADIEPYLMTDPKWSWTWDATGKVSAVSGNGA